MTAPMTGIMGPLFSTVILDGSGNGYVRFAPAGEQWSIINVSVSATPATAEAQATMYINQISTATRHSGTYTGSSGDNNQLDPPLQLTDGQALYIQWVGGTPGATATAIVSGMRTVVNRGFRAA